MPGTFGNKNAVGNKGGGRKSAYQELSDARDLWAFFETPINKEKLTRKIMSGDFTPKEVWMLKVISGNDRLISDMFKKLYPDSFNIQTNMNQKQMQTIEENVRTILGVAATITKKKAVVGGDDKRIRENVGVALQALKDKRKKKIRIKA